MSFSMNWFIGMVISAKNSIRYVTSNKQNADIIQAFAHITGRCALLRSRIEAQNIQTGVTLCCGYLADT